MRAPLTKEQENFLIAGGNYKCPVCGFRRYLKTSRPHWYNNKRTIMIKFFCPACSMWAVVSYRIHAVEMSEKDEPSSS